MGLMSCPPSPEVFEIDTFDLLPLSQRTKHQKIDTLEQDEDEEDAVADEESDDEEEVAVKKRS